MIFPDVFEQHGARHHLAGVAHQVFEQPEFARLQVDLLAAAGRRCGPAGPVRGRRLRAVVLTPSVPLRRRERIDARQQFGEGVGLGEIIVAAGAAGPSRGHRLRRGRTGTGRASCCLRRASGGPSSGRRRAAACGRRRRRRSCRPERQMQAVFAVGGVHRRCDRLSRSPCVRYAAASRSSSTTRILMRISRP